MIPSLATSKHLNLIIWVKSNLTVRACQKIYYRIVKIRGERGGEDAALGFCPYLYGRHTPIFLVFFLCSFFFFLSFFPVTLKKEIISSI